MRSLWNESEAARCRSTLELRAYTSRLLGADPSLVLQGGGNTSLKSVWSMAGEPPVDCLYVKGSGADLSQVGPGDFTPLRRGPLGALLDGPTLDNDALMAALAPVQLRPDAPRPSIETLLHAAIPQPYVEHTHADAVLAVVNTADGRRRARDVFGERAPVVPFRHSGFELAAACRTTWQREATAQTIGLILEFHGVVAFGPDARTAYENMITLVDRAETYLQRRGAWTLARADAPVLDFDGALRMARLRRALSIAAGFPLVLHRDADPEVIAFVQRPDLSVLAQQGPPTPQHAVFTKRLPLLDGDVAAYVGRYRSVLRRFAPTDRPSQQLPDPAPRVVLDPTLGLVA
ncbi:MAG: class II aldolase/adducin family protein, partial [Burkholderiales bacterium]|nr:class II aldolase/adducin family protein [Burkholderiales bacterium]